MAYKVETDVQRFYQNELSKLEKVMKKDVKKFELSTKFMKNINTDGYLLIDGSHLVLCEFKNRYNFSGNITDMAITILQALYYMREFKVKTSLIPEVLFIGDEDEYFVISTEQFIEFLENNPEDTSWNCPPSDAYRRCPKLLSRIEEICKKLQYRVKKLENRKVDLEYTSNIIKQSFSNVKTKIKFNSESVKYGYKLFVDEVLYRPDDFSSLEKVSLFKDLIMKEGRVKFDKTTECFILDEKKYPVRRSAFEDFRSLYQVKYTQKEQSEVLEKITELYNERERVEKSAFPKEKEIVDYAHKMMSKHLGKDWKEKYIVWDPRCYTGNLTKDYKFENLYLSNPFAEELNLIPNRNRCKEAFQFDFKDDAIKPISRGGKLPDELYKALKETPEKVVIFTDPEMGNNGHGLYGNVKGNDTSRVHDQMSVKEKLRNQLDSNKKSANELSNLYMFRSLELSVNFIGIFSTISFLTTSSNKTFKELIFKNLKMLDNFVYKSKSGFPLIFSIFSKDSNHSNDDKLHFIKIDKSSKEISKDLDKEYFTGQGDLLRQLIKTKETNLVISKICLSMPTTEKNTETGRYKIALKNYLGSSATHCLIGSKNINRGIYSAPYSNDHGSIVICHDNLFGACLQYALRSVVIEDVYNSKDDFIVPENLEMTLNRLSKHNFNKSTLDEFIVDSLVLSLCDTNSFQSSLRRENGATVDLKNEWYPLTGAETINLFKEHDFQKGIDDYNTFFKKDTYICKLLNKLENLNMLSKESKNLLESLKQVYRSSFKIRRQFYEKNPNLHLFTWDCGFWQIKQILKISGKTHLLTNLNSNLQILKDKMEPKIYELGFLKR